MRTPDWWYRKNAKGAPWWRFVLWPLSLIWLTVSALKAATAKPYRSSLKVISVGNLTLGGSGKTPLVFTLLHFLENSVGLSRGHGGKLKGPLKVDPRIHTAADVGDEPLLLANGNDFWISKDRAAGLTAVEATGASIVVVDDAHQNTKIVKDIHILVIDGETGGDAWPFGDGGICPYGPMREPLSKGLARADVIVVWLPDGKTEVDPKLMALLGDKPVFMSRLASEMYWGDKPVLAFAGIAKPWRFEATLRMLNYNIVGFESFADHEMFSEKDLEGLASKAEYLGASLITTEKDWVRLSGNWRKKVKYVRIFSQPDNLAEFIELLKSLTK